MFEFKIEGENIEVEISGHAFHQSQDRNVSEYAVYGCVVKLGEDLLDKKNKQNFAIIDYDENTAIICCLHNYVEYIHIDVITVVGGLPASEIYITRGTEVHKVGDLLSE